MVCGPTVLPHHPPSTLVVNDILYTCMRRETVTPIRVFCKDCFVGPQFAMTGSEHEPLKLSQVCKIGPALLGGMALFCLQLYVCHVCSPTCILSFTLKSFRQVMLAAFHAAIPENVRVDVISCGRSLLACLPFLLSSADWCASQ